MTENVNKARLSPRPINVEGYCLCHVLYEQSIYASIQTDIPERRLRLES